MVRIDIGEEAFEAIKATLPIGSVGYEAERRERGTAYLNRPSCDRQARRDARAGGPTAT
jgi:hypothetical protein